MRKKTIQTIIYTNNKKKIENMGNVSKWFGINTFNEEVMKSKLSKSMYSKMKKVMEGKENLTVDVANEVAHGMKEWALENGATHFAHWFLPLTGSTAEKHDSFLTYDENRKMVERFSGKELVRQEPDASSFPSGGLRATFEARGYTAWDPTSPAFLIEDKSGKTLCIPSIFISYNGYSLDQKSPLLKSVDVIENSVRKFLDVFGIEPKKVLSYAGVEQEFFLVDSLLASLRPDLTICGRTLIGAKPAKGQEMDDQYFGSIKERFIEYMRDVEHELYKLGIPLHTRHNEVAPHQFEFAPIFEDVNLACDHNQLLMEVLRKKAKDHNLFVSLHEKPFAGINGSGKHVNWNISADSLNMLDPGDNPHENMIFLFFLTAVLRGVYEHNDLLRASVASCSNDHRLGGHEAPPAIMSVFVGKHLTDVIQKIINNEFNEVNVKELINTGISKIPKITKDTTDRNRTSPFAFTGNKFEFRAVGSKQSISIPITILNVITADSLDYMRNILIEEMKDSDNDILKSIYNVVRKVLKQASDILFEGDNYSEEWRIEAEKRGLYNLKKSDEALKRFTDDKKIELLTKNNVFSKEELHARYEVEIERYCKEMLIEARLIRDMAQTIVLPALLEHQKLILENLKLIKELCQNQNIEFLNLESTNLIKKVDKILLNISKIDEVIRESECETNIENCACICSQNLNENINNLREVCDDIEKNISDKLWTLPKYSELLFVD
ncbi:MAG: glutamine synthetase III [Candidatus Muirbacterium halophilum]|nr:glutamine synthetase III [Candidatus Muirbacterium halophilum]MCK9474827.1 glutamine synthetase III [Candidatus Muirbacterium halophilum]